MARRLQRGDNGEVVGNLGIVENALARLDPAFLQYLARERRIGRDALALAAGFAGQHFHGRFDCRQIILRQRARVGARVGQHLVLFVKRLRQRQRRARGETEASVGFALQAGQIEQQRRNLAGGLGFLGGDAGPALAFLAQAFGARHIPQALGLGFGVLVLRRLGELLVEPAPAVAARGGGEARMHFPVVARLELLDAVLALDQDGQRRRLHPAHGGLVETALFGIERSHRARSVDPHQPVGLGTAHGGIGQRQHGLVGPQGLETVADRALGHRLQPQTLDRLPVAGVLHDVAEDQLALAPGVAGVDHAGDVFAFEQLQQQLEPVLGALDRLDVEVRRDHRQVRERPLAAFHLYAFRGDEFEQMADGGGQYILPALEIIAVAGEAAQCARNVGGNGGLFGNDEFLGHGVRSAVERALVNSVARNVNVIGDGGLPSNDAFFGHSEFGLARAGLKHRSAPRSKRSMISANQRAKQEVAATRRDILPRNSALIAANSANA